MMNLLTAIGCICYSSIILTYVAALCGFRSKKRVYLAYIMNIALSFFYIYLTMLRIPIPIIYLITYLLIVLGFRVFFNGMWLQHLLSAGNCIFHIVFVREVVLTLISLYFHKNLYWVIMHQMLYEGSLLLTFLFLSIYFLIYTMKLYPVEKTEILFKKPNYLKLIFNFQLIVNVILIFGSGIYYNHKLPYWFSYYHLMAFFVIAIAFNILFDFCIQSCTLKEMEVDCRVYEEQLKRQVDAYMVQTDYIYRIRKFKQDCFQMQNNLIPILEKNGNTLIASFFRELDSFLQITVNKYQEYSSNPQIQALLYHFNTCCVEHGIAFKATVVFPKRFSLNDFELCCIFTGIITNALNMCNKLKDDQHKFIHISTAMNQNWCTIVCENSYDGVTKAQFDEQRKKSILYKETSVRSLEVILASCGGFIKTARDATNRVCKVSLHIPISCDDGILPTNEK